MDQAFRGPDQIRKSVQRREKLIFSKLSKNQFHLVQTTFTGPNHENLVHTRFVPVAKVYTSKPGDEQIFLPDCNVLLLVPLC